MTNSMDLTVILPAHNPRPEYLRRTLAGLRAQALPYDRWELLVIDNGSDPPLAGQHDLSWHPQGRHFREDVLGVMVARRLGFRIAKADLIVNVDDDNVLAPDYLEQALGIAVRFPNLGVWGGHIAPEFEATPEEWTKPWWNLLAIRSVSQAQWSNLIYQDVTTPPGAGMCIRRPVAEAYVAKTEKEPKRLKLCRQGKGVISAGDCDLAYTACDIGMGTGLFPGLRLTHLISAVRVTEEYLARLVEGINYSTVMLRAIRGDRTDRPPTTWMHWLRDRKHELSLNPRDRRFYRAAKNGQAMAFDELEREQSGAGLAPR
ncbi:MAG: glycosyl transferase family 2 [Akkermansiaceae bacterium]|nr:glycosyl transferase family 2 [Akkermansiaceae bacterium]